MNHKIASFEGRILSIPSSKLINSGNCSGQGQNESAPGIGTGRAKSLNTVK